MSAATSHPTIPTVLARIRNLYEGADDRFVVAFLEQHPEAMDALVEAVPHLHASFGGAIALRLEMPRFDDETVFARVYHHGLGADAALERIEHFDETWWQTQPYEPT